MASYSRLLLQMLPLRRWPLAGLGPLWLSDAQPACRVLWPPAHSLMGRVVSDMEKQFQEMEKISRAFFQASPLVSWEREGRAEACDASDAQVASRGQPDGKYRFSVDVAGFAPEEMEVKLDGRRVTVTAKRQRESRSEESGHWREHQELYRETLLPPEVDLHSVTCSLAPDGQLCVEALRLASASTTGKAIPIDVKPAAQETPSGEQKELGDKPKDP
ncbi:Heat shock protein 30C [Varanus komodoensis]|uniref:heat shock protein 30C-like n=1 Tax=Varanus komodoensis TaxID=61221 RepID=UPI001CF7BCF6|nr:heat shock protein 30C-like [Varanus komodoensis]KAF7237064.1 Heat shock protein 30C [Varanus komodoensis]